MVVALAVSGPFGTLASLGFAARLAYWAAVVVLTLGAGWLAIQGCVHALARRGIGRIGHWLITGLTVSAVTAAVVRVLNVLAVGFYVTDRGAAVDLLASTVPIALVVNAAFIWVFPPPATPQTTGPQPPRLLARLRLDKRFGRISLSVQDHSVEVVTLRGRDLRLMRLSDAIAKTGGDIGPQVHRSHWLALDQGRAARGRARAVDPVGRARDPRQPHLCRRSENGRAVLSPAALLSVNDYLLAAGATGV